MELQEVVQVVAGEENESLPGVGAEVQEKGSHVREFLAAGVLSIVREVS